MAEAAPKTVTLTTPEFLEQRERALANEVAQLEAALADKRGALNEVRRLRSVLRPAGAPAEVAESGTPTPLNRATRRRGARTEH